MGAPANRAIVIGGSSGALDALALILPALPSGFVTPIAIVIHVQPGRPSGLVNLFRTQSSLEVKEAEDKEPIAPGIVYVAPPSYHLLIESAHHFSLSVDDHVHFSRPAIDVLFESAADAYGRALTGVLLSGANEDGAHGLARIFAAGGATVVQDPRTAVARQMPEAALGAGCSHRVLSPREIAPCLARFDRERLVPHSPPTEERG